MEYYLSLKENEIFSSSTKWMELENIRLCKLKHRKSNSIMFSLISGNQKRNNSKVT